MNILEAFDEILHIIETHTDEELQAILDANDKKHQEEQGQ